MIAGSLVLFVLYCCATYQICLMSSFQCLLYFDLVIADITLNGPGATLCNRPNHRINDDKYHYMTAEESLDLLHGKLMEVYRQGKYIEPCFAFDSEAACCFDTNICFQSWFGGAVRKFTLKIMLDFMFLCSQIFTVHIRSVFKANTFFFSSPPNCLLCSLC